MNVLIGAKVLTEQGLLDDYVVVFDEVIHAVEPHSVYASRRDGSYEEIYVDGYVVPGFIDIHIHGSKGCDVMDGTASAIETIAKSVVKSGTTAFLATTMTLSEFDIKKALNAVRDSKVSQKGLFEHGIASGARVLGAHMEGPFINPAFKGAQNVEHIQRPTVEWLIDYLDVVKMITYAPEMDDDFAFAKALRDQSVVLSIGHSGCDYETASRAFDEGVDHVTHCFNAMTPLHHRNPGVVGAALTKPFTIDIITDGIHVHSGFMGPFIELKGIDKTILITDAMRAAMMPDGQYDLGGQMVEVANGCCKLHDGTLAGSVLSMDQALRNMLSLSNIPFEHVIRMLSENPAKKLNIFDSKGSIRVGKDADLVVLSPDFLVYKVFVSGILNEGEGVLI